MLRGAIRASTATLGLAIFVDVPSKSQPHALTLPRADAVGATYRGVAANATQTVALRNFQLSLDAVFAPCGETTFESLKSAYGGWSASRSAVAWEEGQAFRLSDLLPPLAQAVSGRHFTPMATAPERLPTALGAADEVLCGINCWGFAYGVLEAAAAAADRVTLSAGAHGDAWEALVAVTEPVQSTQTTGHGLLGEGRNAALQPGDLLMLSHQNEGEECYLDHVAIVIDDDLYLEKAGSGANTPFRLIDWEGLVASWPDAVFEWDWRRRAPGTTVPPASEAFGAKRGLAPRRLGVRAEALVIAPYADTKQLSWVKTLDEPLQMDDRGRAVLPEAAFEASAFAVIDGADPEEPTGSKDGAAPEEPTSLSVAPEEPTGSKAARAATWTRHVAEGPAPPGRVPAATCTSGGGLFIFGGETDAPPWSPIPNRYLNDVWRLDLRSGRWEELSPDGAPGAPDPRVCASAVASDAGELVVYGGIRRRGGEHETMGDLWTFSTTTKRWTKTEASGAAPGPLAGHAAARVKGDCAIVYGGAHPEAALSDETYLLDLKTKAWTRRAPGPAARDFHVLLSSPDGVLMWGGADDGVWRYCVETDAWTKDADLPYLSGRSGVVLNDGSVVSVGGMSLVDRVAQYDAEVLMRSSGAAFRAVDAAADAPPGRCFPALAAAPDGSVLMFGGYRRIDGESQERLDDVWKLELRPAPPRTMTPPFD